LRDWGFIEDTGDRRGTTKQVIVYQLKTPENGPVKAPQDEPKVDGNAPEIGGVEQAQKRDASTEETGPNFPPNRPVFPHKEARFSPQTGPKTGHGTINNHQEPSRNLKNKARELPGWLPLEAWTGYLEMRKAKKKAPTERALDLVLIDLARFRAEGHNIAAILDASTVNGWTGVFAPRPQARATPYQAKLQNTQNLIDRIQRKPSHDPDDTIIDLNERPA